MSYTPHNGMGYGDSFVLILVLFILLVIIGSAYMY
ncbi:YjcZ family sporulation protein [Salipaludibacillus aurantiacus]|uniref:Conserved hypothetical tiny transmembrane protein n=1 Tax=Salipaludibacillus aurantiacus TaxID=1601833 RepID=A0A1H9RTY3_9BACI|nr:YjcZ family sporulation protein [Salipaludibacillus aurantiacus]SER75875.1 conserved hypothetical tiny transmembrane protein [Salipaludibacillus aurantiacus]